MSERPQGPINSPHEFTVLLRARNHLEAELVVGVLKADGILAHVPGGLLADEFAVSQRLLNLNAVDVLVPAARAADARAALERARAAGAAMAQEDAAQEDGESAAPTTSAAGAADGQPAQRYPWLLVSALTVLSVTFLMLFLEERNKVRRLSNPLTEYSGQVEGADLWVWAGTKVPASRTTDHNGNGVPEWLTTYSRSGRALHTMRDRNENGVYEEFVSFGANGAERITGFDSDEDGIIERAEEALGAQTLVTLYDRSEGTLLRLELRDASGRTVRAWQVDASEGIKSAQ